MMSRLRPFHLVLFLLAALSAGEAAAQAMPSAPRGQSVRGRVLDSNTGEPVSAVSVRAVEENGNAAVVGRSDAVGGFTIRLPIAGTYRFTAERIGFTTSTSEPVQVAAGAVAEVVLRLTPSAVALEAVGVQVRATPPFRDARAARYWERMDRGQGVFVTPDQINARPVARTTDFLRQISRVHIVGDPVRGTMVEMGTASSRRCTPTMYIDGFRRRLVPGERLDDLIDRKDLWAIEVYTRSDEAPSELPADDINCGVVIIWTRHA